MTSSYRKEKLLRNITAARKEVRLQSERLSSLYWLLDNQPQLMEDLKLRAEIVDAEEKLSYWSNERETLETAYKSQYLK